MASGAAADALDTESDEGVPVPLSASVSPDERLPSGQVLLRTLAERMAAHTGASGGLRPVEGLRALNEAGIRALTRTPVAGTKRVNLCMYNTSDRPKMAQQCCVFTSVRRDDILNATPDNIAGMTALVAMDQTTPTPCLLCHWRDLGITARALASLDPTDKGALKPGQCLVQWYGIDKGAAPSDIDVYGPSDAPVGRNNGLTLPILDINMRTVQLQFNSQEFYISIRRQGPAPPASKVKTPMHYAWACLMAAGGGFADTLVDIMGNTHTDPWVAMRALATEMATPHKGKDRAASRAAVDVCARVAALKADIDASPHPYATCVAYMLAAGRPSLSDTTVRAMALARASGAYAQSFVSPCMPSAYLVVFGATNEAWLLYDSIMDHVGVTPAYPLTRDLAAASGLLLTLQTRARTCPVARHLLYNMTRTTTALAMLVDGVDLVSFQLAVPYATGTSAEMELDAFSDHIVWNYIKAGAVAVGGAATHFNVPLQTARASTRRRDNRLEAHIVYNYYMCAATVYPALADPTAVACMHFASSLQSDRAWEKVPVPATLAELVLTKSNFTIENLLWLATWRAHRGALCALGLSHIARAPGHVVAELVRCCTPAVRTKTLKRMARAITTELPSMPRRFSLVIVSLSATAEAQQRAAVQQAGIAPPCVYVCPVCGLESIEYTHPPDNIFKTHFTGPQDRVRPGRNAILDVTTPRRPGEEGDLMRCRVYGCKQARLRRIELYGIKVRLMNGAWAMACCVCGRPALEHLCVATVLYVYRCEKCVRIKDDALRHVILEPTES